MTLKEQIPDLSELERIAREATPGPWFRSGVRQKVGGADTHSVVATVDGTETIISSVWYDPRTHDGFRDAVFSATFNPETVLRLIALAREGEGSSRDHAHAPSDALEWQPIDTAPKDGARVLVMLKDPIPEPGRADLRNWDGRPFVARWMGAHSEWGFAAPVGHAGFPDKWIAGWRPVPPFSEPKSIGSSERQRAVASAPRDTQS